MDNQDKPIRVGSRKSELALIQTKHVIGLLQKLYRNKKFEIHTMSTIGDRVLNVSLPKIGEKSLFTRDLEDALRNGGVDFVVHSLKDLPTALPTGMAIGAVLEREDARDALVLKELYKNHTLQTLPKGCVIGTSSLRRTAQLRRQYPHLTVCDIRGNLNTRLAKLDAPNSNYDGIILAQAGLVRMGWISRISQVLEPTDLLYAVGQGALAVECRANDIEILEMLRSLNCLQTTCRILAERSFLKTLGGGCSAPVAVVSKLNGAQLDYVNDSDETTSLALEGAVWSLNGDTEIRDQLSCTLIVPESKKRTAANGASASADDGNGNGNCNDVQNDHGPPQKRNRQDDASSDSGSDKCSPQRLSPPVINDDVVSVPGAELIYDWKALAEKHKELAKKCPVLSKELNAVEENANSTRYRGGGGDADCNVAPSSSNQHCPLRIDIGQDFMGECPFVNKDEKVMLSSIGKCPMTQGNIDDKNGNNNIDNNKAESVADEGDQVDRMEREVPITILKCPYSGHEKPLETVETLASVDDANNIDATASVSSKLTKCPFLQKTVQLFDYADEERPMPQKINALIEDIDELFCGLYQHKCFNRELYVKANELGKQLADNLILKGALKVMEVAQAEIHSKIS